MKFKESKQFMCGYLPLETANARFVDPNQKLTNQIYSKLSEEDILKNVMLLNDLIKKKI